MAQSESIQSGRPSTLNSFSDEERDYLNLHLPKQSSVSDGENIGSPRERHKAKKKKRLSEVNTQTLPLDIVSQASSKRQTPFTKISGGGSEDGSVPSKSYLLQYKGNMYPSPDIVGFSPAIHANISERQSRMEVVPRVYLSPTLDDGEDDTRDMISSESLLVEAVTTPNSRKKHRRSASRETRSRIATNNASTNTTSNINHHGDYHNHSNGVSNGENNGLSNGVSNGAGVSNCTSGESENLENEYEFLSENGQISDSGAGVEPVSFSRTRSGVDTGGEETIRDMTQSPSLLVAQLLRPCGRVPCQCGNCPSPTHLSHSLQRRSSEEEITRSSDFAHGGSSRSITPKLPPHRRHHSALSDGYGSGAGNVVGRELSANAIRSHGSPEEEWSSDEDEGDDFEEDTISEDLSWKDQAVLQASSFSITGLIGGVFSGIFSIFVWVFLLLRIDVVAKRFCPDVYWAVARPVRARSCYNELKEAVLESAAVQQIIGHEVAEDVLARRRLRELKANRPGNFKLTPNRQRMKKAEALYGAMAANPNLLVLRIYAYVIRKVWRWMYPLGIHLSEEEMRTVMSTAQKGPLILLPTHKSHVDYLLVTYMCFDYGLPIPYVVAGENLNIPIIGSLLRMGGALFIPRSFAGDTDKLSVTIFGEYIKAILERGHSIECFIEGGRSRTGKVLQPKVGMLSRVVEWVSDETNTAHDVFVVPISLGYDRIVENASHIEELAGGVKERERLSSSMKNISSIIASGLMNVTCYGRVDVRIASPYSLREYLVMCRENLAKKQVNITDKFALTKHMAMSVGFQTLHLCNKVSVGEPAALVATVLMTHCKRGMSRAKLRTDVLWLRKLILKHGGRVVNIHPEYVDIVLNLVLGPIIGKNQLVKKHKDLLMVDLYSPKERIELSLYQNQIIHHFVPAGIVSMALYKTDKRKREHPDSSVSSNTDISASISSLEEDVKFLSSLLKFEFIFPPTSDLKKNLTNTLSAMVEHGTLVWGDSEKLSVQVRNSDDALETYLFYATLFWRFIDSYYLVALGFFYLLPDRVLCESLFLKQLQALGEKLYFGGQLDLYEAIAKETLTNSISLFINWNVAEYLRIEGSAHPGDTNHVPGKRVLRLLPAFQSEKALKSLVNRIGSYRKSVRAYRSKRFRIRHKNVDHDAIDLVKSMAFAGRTPPSTPPDSPGVKKVASVMFTAAR